MSTVIFFYLFLSLSFRLFVFSSFWLTFFLSFLCLFVFCMFVFLSVCLVVFSSFLHMWEMPKDTKDEAEEKSLYLKLLEYYLWIILLKHLWTKHRTFVSRRILRQRKVLKISNRRKKNLAVLKIKYTFARISLLGSNIEKSTRGKTKTQLSWVWRSICYESWVRSYRGRAVRTLKASPILSMKSKWEKYINLT